MYIAAAAVDVYFHPELKYAFEPKIAYLLDEKIPLVPAPAGS
jgi:hypothetical protein